MRRNYYSKDPRWIRAKYPGRCRCGRTVKPGDRAFYYPISRKLVCRDCGRTAEMEITEDDLNAVLKVF